MKIKKMNTTVYTTKMNTTVYTTKMNTTVYTTKMNTTVYTTKMNTTVYTTKMNTTFLRLFILESKGPHVFPVFALNTLNQTSLESSQHSQLT
jgi:hypothetical protein